MLREEEEGGSLSLTEMLLKELESEVLKSHNFCDDELSRDAHTPPMVMSWQAALLKPSSKDPPEGQSFMEMLDGEVRNEASGINSLSESSMDYIIQRSQRTNISDEKPAVERMPPSMPPYPLPNAAMPPHPVPNTAPPPHPVPNTALPPPSMMNLPPPQSYGIPPPNLPFPAMGPISVPPPSSVPPTGCPMVPMMCPPPAPCPPPFMNGMYPAGPVNFNQYGQTPFYGYGNTNYSNTNVSFSSVAEIPDTTLATQLKLKKKKKTKKEPKDSSDAIIFADAATKSPSPDSTKAPTAAIQESVASIVPPTPDSPKVAPKTPVESIVANMKHVKEHKLVIKMDKRTLKEKTPVKMPDKKRAAVTEYASESDDGGYDVEAYRKRQLHRSITSVRLDENEGLPELYSKLKKLNEELAMLQKNEASNSSESESSDSSKKERNSWSKKKKKYDLKNKENHNNGKTLDNSTCRASPLVISEENSTAQRTKLDVRIKMLINDEKTTPSRTSSILTKPDTPIRTAPAEELHDPKGRTVSFEKLPPPSAAIVAARYSQPLDRAPSPFLSKEIYHYWHKESVKFRKFLKKSPKFIHIDAFGRYKFRKNRFAPVTKNTLRSAEALNIYSMLDRKLVKNTASLEKKASEDHEKAAVSAEIEEDLKRLEAITRELQMLEEEERKAQEGSINEYDDAQLLETADQHDKMNKLDHNDSLLEVSDDYKKLEEIRRQLRELEEEEAREQSQLLTSRDDKTAPKETDAILDDKFDSDCATFDVESLQKTLSAELMKTDSPNPGTNCVQERKSEPENVTQKAKNNRGVKRAPDEHLISLVMSSVMEELKKDLKTSIANNLMQNQHKKLDAFASKKQKTEA
ncbi:hypothetical protein HAZT_HAZT010920 [Hyalella azteca]|nr:hypothetical protein HAZT_HAZT010920 [Hyalella azteca]